MLAIVAHGLTDDCHWHVVLMGYGGPGVAADVRSELQSQQFAKFFECLVIVGRRAEVTLVGGLLVAVVRQNGKQVSGGRWVAVDDGLHVGFDLHNESLPCLTSAVGDETAADVALAKVGHIDEGHATGTEAKQEHVAGKGEFVRLLTEEGTICFLPSHTARAHAGRRLPRRRIL